MEMRKFACALFSLAFLFSCSEESLPEAVKPTLNLQKISNRIGVEDAINYVEEARALLDKESPSESRYSRAVNSVSALVFSDDVKASAMKSGKYKDLGISDTLAYVFNFGDSSGFVIVSKDKRVETPLFAFVEKGTLINGETDNPGLALFLERLEGYVLESIAKSEKGEEKKEVMAVAQKGPYDPYFLDIMLNPLVSVKWGQEKPFNNNLEYKGCSPRPSNGRVWAGCTATATAHIMSYWKYPTTINNKTYNWESLNNYKNSDAFYSSGGIALKIAAAIIARRSVASLFEQIGAEGTGISMKYGCDGSYASEFAVMDFLVSNGFTLFNNKYFISYDLDQVASFLFSGPLIVYGCAQRGCHLWVIDGLSRAVWNSYVNYFVHNNWGWDGQYDGYYLSGVFDPGSDDYQKIKLGLVYR